MTGSTRVTAKKEPVCSTSHSLVLLRATRISAVLQSTLLSKIASDQANTDNNLLAPLVIVNNSNLTAYYDIIYYILIYIISMKSRAIYHHK